MEFVNKGHFFDLDMLDTGDCSYLMHVAEYDKAPDYGLTEDEQLVAYSMRAFLNSPIQISSNLDNITDFEFSMYCNEEIIAINQDHECNIAYPILMIEDEATSKKVHVFKKKLARGDYAICAFNLGKTAEKFSVCLDCEALVRDVWAKRDCYTAAEILLDMPPHTVRVFRVTP